MACGWVKIRATCIHANTSRVPLCLRFTGLRRLVERRNALKIVRKCSSELIKKSCSKYAANKTCGFDWRSSILRPRSSHGITHREYATKNPPRSSLAECKIVWIHPVGRPVEDVLQPPKGRRETLICSWFDRHPAEVAGERPP